MSSGDKVSLYPNYCSIIKITPKEGYEILTSQFTKLSSSSFDMEVLSGKRGSLSLSTQRIYFTASRPLGAFGSMSISWDSAEEDSYANIDSLYITIPRTSTEREFVYWPVTEIRPSVDNTAHISIWNGFFKTIEGIYITGSVKISHLILALSI